MRVTRAYYNFALDGGAVGSIILRGAQKPPYVWVVGWALLEVDLVGFGALTTLDFGTTVHPTLMGSGVDSTYSIGTAPYQWFFAPTGLSVPGLLFEPAQPLTMTINTDPLTAGELWLYLFSVPL